MKCEPFKVFTRQEILLINFAHRFPPIVVKKKKKKKTLKIRKNLRIAISVLKNRAHSLAIKF